MFLRLRHPHLQDTSLVVCAGACVARMEYALSRARNDTFVSVYNFDPHPTKCKILAQNIRSWIMIYRRKCFALRILSKNLWKKTRRMWDAQEVLAPQRKTLDQRALYPYILSMRGTETLMFILQRFFRTHSHCMG